MFRKKLILLFALLSGYNVVNAQLNATLYHMTDLPLNHILNPAFQPRNGNVYAGFPGLSSLYLGADIVSKHLTFGNIYGDKRDIPKVINSMEQYGLGTVNFDYRLIDVGVYIKDIFFTLGVSAKGNADISISRDFAELTWYGNAHPNILGRTLDFSGTDVSISSYAEISLGFSKELKKDAFTFGGKLKFLQGIAHVDAYLDKGSSLRTDPYTRIIDLIINPNIDISGIPFTIPSGNFTINDMNISFDDYKFKLVGSGMGIDLGLVWKPEAIQELTASVSVINLGYTRWKGGYTEPAIYNNKYTFYGFDLEDKNFFDALVDSIKKVIEINGKYTNFSKGLNPTIYLGGNYELHKFLNVGALLVMQTGKYKTIPLFAVSANTQRLPVNISISASYYSKPNLGIGLLFGKKNFQFHVTTDNILVLNYNLAQSASIRLGLNFLFGKSKEHKDNLSKSARTFLNADKPREVSKTDGLIGVKK
ncbi:MAG: DUF5723 family protein [Prevotellaceae bacterium]|jgi:hypothetical protein|nr:DUF5723 family protein [Prevotellaceae bacterium]